MLINSLLSTLPFWFRDLPSKKIKESSAHKSELEQYIIAHNPQSTYDVERLTYEFDRKVNRKIGW